MQRKGGVPRTHNRLWLARKRRGLEQKHVAALLGLSREQVSRFEKGQRIPNLKTALGLQIILGVSVRLLFSDLYDELEEEIAHRIAQSAAFRRMYGELFPNELGTFAERCPLADLLDTSLLPDDARERIREHAAALYRRLSDI